MSSELEQKLQIRAEAIHKDRGGILQPEIGIELFVDGLCENPGAMHIGLYARQGINVLFAEHLAVGHGTCNEAEYIAVKSGLTLLQLVFPTPGVSICVHSDSQLVVKQVAGEWRSSGQMQIYCMYLRKLQRSYPFGLKKVPREENQIADGLAQKYITKNSGRCMSIDQGRFNVSKSATVTVKNADLYNALVSIKLKEYFKEYNLHDDIEELRRLAITGEQESAVKLARQIEEKAIDILKKPPDTNEMVTLWLTSTIGLIQKGIPEIVRAIETGNEVELQYWLDEMSGKSNDSGEVFDSLVENLKDPLAQYQPDPVLQGEHEGDYNQ